MSLVATAAILATLTAGSSLVMLGLRRRFTGAAAAPVFAPEVAPATGAVAEVLMADQVVARVEGLLTAQTQVQADALADLKAEILGLKSDVEWLAGERMIEQAIALAQSGIEADEIGRELGMSRDAAETIVAFRRH